MQHFLKERANCVKSIALDTATGDNGLSSILVQTTGNAVRWRWGPGHIQALHQAAAPSSGRGGHIRDGEGAHVRSHGGEKGLH